MKKNRFGTLSDISLEKALELDPKSDIAGNWEKYPSGTIFVESPIMTEHQDIDNIPRDVAIVYKTRFSERNQTGGNPTLITMSGIENVTDGLIANVLKVKQIPRYRTAWQNVSMLPGYDPISEETDSKMNEIVLDAVITDVHSSNKNRYKLLALLHKKFLKTHEFELIIREMINKIHPISLDAFRKFLDTFRNYYPKDADNLNEILDELKDKFKEINGL